ncbi:MAG: GLUG motif-containing protein [Oscillospiraceae bacterium]
MKQSKKRNMLSARLLSGLLSLLLLLSLCPAVFAAEGTIPIGTLEELTAFAKRCASDDYSNGLTVVLTADIDVDGDAVSIPIFLGSFDGQGHKITGLQLTESNSSYGLFSRVEAGATVKNLTVEGEIAPSGTQSAIGGIVGENYGSVENCRFSGVVIGSSSVGGIAGRNSGTLTGCTASGAVRGTQYTGGIAGQNNGTLLRCENATAVNTTVSEADIAEADLENLENTFYRILKREEITENAVTSDTGGVAGYSTGAIQSCTNTGSVGYPHVGYNVGGIAGRQNGYLASCINRGEVQGRKDVGGIVGQMVPDITLHFSESGLDELQGELNTLQSLINRMLDDAQAASDSISGRISRISGYADSARDSANSLTGQLGDFADNNIDTANSLLLLVERYIDKIVPAMDDLNSASGSMTEAIAEVRNLLNSLDGTLGYNDTALSQLQSFCSEMASACDALLTGLDALENTFSLMQGGTAVPDTTQLRESIAALRDASVSLQATIGRALEEIGISGGVTPETAAQLKTDLLSVLNCYGEVCRNFADVLINTDFGALRQQNEETLREILASLQTAMDSFYAATSHLSAAMGHLYDALGTLRSINEQMEDIFSQLDAVLSSAQQSAEAMSSALSKAAQWVRDLSGEDIGSFSPLGPEFSESNNALNTSLSGISNELSALNSELTGSNATLLSDVRAVNNQFMKVMNLFLNLLNNTQDVDYTDVFEDVSEETLQSATRGKVLECANYGAVTADRNAGGISGAMAIEYDADPEDDLLSSGKRSTRFTYQTKAILLDCNNYGTVQAKKSCAGGITGRMDLGTISGCGGWGSVESESGDYVGGVAGLSLSSIRASYAKCTLSGGKYVGGIVGSGGKLSDCISMVEISACTQLGGAIAGEISGEYTGNRFVSDTLAGVDRVSLSGKAEQISYAALKELENIPENFLHLTLRFVADNTVLTEQEFNYGDSFSEEIYPQAPDKDGFYIHWDRTNLSDLRFDTVVTAEYEPYITTLSSEDKREGHPSVLAEGNFQEGVSLRAEAADNPASLLNGAAEVWTLTIPDVGQESHTVRWRFPAGDASYTIYEKKNDRWKKVSSEAVGQYLCFELSGNQFAAVPSTQTAWWVWAAAGGGVMILSIVLLLLGKRAKSNQRKKHIH